MPSSLFRPLRRLTCAALLLAPLFAGATGFTSDRISVRVEGKGPDVILVPGLASSPKVWTGVVERVPGYRYHLVQVAGFAGVPAGGNSAGLVSAPVAEEIARYIAEQHLDKPALIGHSMGGSIGLMIAARHPQAISKLMVVDMVPFLGVFFGPPGTTAESIKPIADGLLAKMTAADPEARKKRAEATIKSMVNNEAMQPVGIEDSNSTDPSVSGRAYHELIVTDLREELKKVVAPVTVLYIKPKAVPMADAQFDEFYKWHYSNLKSPVMKHISDSAHFIMWDQPQVFEAEVKAFLK